MKKNMLVVAVLGVFLLFNPSAYADTDGGHPMWHHAGGMMGYSHHEQSQCPITRKFMMKAHALLENQKELGLSADQVKTIKDLKLQMEKDSIRQKADQEIFQLDLKSKLGEDKIDVEGTNALIDKAFASSTAAAKSNLEAYAKLKNVLTPDQLAKMKDFWKNKKEGSRENRAEETKGE